MNPRLLVMALASMLALECAGARALCAEDAPKAYALIVSGDGDEANFAENYKDWSARLYKILTETCGMPAAQVTLLAEKKDLIPQIVHDVSTKENVLKAFKNLAATVKAGDQVLIFFIGHGSSQTKSGKLCLPGPDLKSEEVAEALGKLATREVALVHTASRSDSFLDACSLPGRTIITATNSEAEGNETYFMEFFLKAFETKAADVDKDGVVNLLEAFNYAAIECPKWYLRQYFVDKVGWRVEGKQSRALWQKFYGSVKDKKSAPPENADAEDADPVLGEWGPQWAGRRMPTEHAQLDDNGDHTGTAVFVNNEFVLLGEKDGEDGNWAGQITPGKPRGDKRPPSAPLAPAAPKP